MVSSHMTNSKTHDNTRRGELRGHVREFGNVRNLCRHRMIPFAKCSYWFSFTDLIPHTAQGRRDLYHTSVTIFGIFGHWFIPEEKWLVREKFRGI